MMSRAGEKGKGNCNTNAMILQIIVDKWSALCYSDSRIGCLFWKGVLWEQGTDEQGGDLVVRKQLVFVEVVR